MKRTIYFHTDRTMLAGSQVREEDFPESWIRTQMVHPHFAGEFRELFRDVHKKGGSGQQRDAVSGKGRRI